MAGGEKTWENELNSTTNLSKDWYNVVQLVFAVPVYVQCLKVGRGGCVVLGWQYRSQYATPNVFQGT